jgi:hypothetical protein
MCTILFDRKNHLCHLEGEIVVTDSMFARRVPINHVVDRFIVFIESVNREII